MKRVVVAIALLVPAAASAQYYQTDFPAEEFRRGTRRCSNKSAPHAVAVVQGVPQTEGFTLPRQHNTFYYLSGIETPGAYLLLDGRTKKVTIYLPPRNPQLEAAEGRVLSAEDVELVKRVSGVDDVKPLRHMTGTNWPLVATGRAPAAEAVVAGRRLAIFAEFSPPENSGKAAASWCRPKRRASTTSGTARLTPAALRRAAALAASAIGSAQPQSDPRRDAQHQEPARDRDDPPRLADRRPRADGGDAQHRARRHRVSARRRRELRLQGQRRAARGLSLDHRDRHREHQQHALLPQHRRR